ncbi:pyridoxamine 5'-phosphate oxidase family protein [Streptomyces mirabilis]|jgi:nitroimidazol reductase NimA-like FMN-containing flavoprotein (pyridoxamine 5'-phosphate oxidase superfamily)|uniref:Pyridoxamine 5'-phosphate oxidase n=1 Tax=Streptomyces mirabilis TaxID=68239 RepID=A0A1I2XCT1_9ACTN|nr:pyridoxamine 5'-phosphate oxidase family protein [Streptomyces mirabilis]SFH11308.1 Pyridoxamine 5'-phosphate oxidase [Streptomyces mirabilis]
MCDDKIDAILAGDLTAALGCVTGAGGVIVSAVAPIGLRNREQGTVGFTTSLGFGRKLSRMRANPRVALAYHAREHGLGGGPQYVLVQGTASFDKEPSQQQADEITERATRYVGLPLRGPLWDRWMSTYYGSRLLVTIAVQRIVSWPDCECTGEPTVVMGAPLPTDPPLQSPPRQGTGPRVDVTKAGKHLDRVSHRLLGYRGDDGYPIIVPVEIGKPSPAGLPLSSSAGVPTGGRRAGLLGHTYGRQLIGMEARQYTGWLEDGVYAPHTAAGFAAPPLRVPVLLVNGLKARQALKRADRSAAAVAHRSDDAPAS